MADGATDVVTRPHHDATTPLVPQDGRGLDSGGRVGGPVRVAWQEGTLTRAKELESLLAWSQRPSADADERRAMQALESACREHLRAAREAATERHPRRTSGSRIERAHSNLDAAEADMMQLARPEYLLGQLANILNHIQRHLKAGDPRRSEVEWLAVHLGPARNEDLATEAPTKLDEARRREIASHRHAIVSAYRGASSAALREQTRIRSFRNVVVLTTIGMLLVAVALIVVGAVRPTAIPLCFSPQEADTYMVVCPMQQSATLPIPTPPTDGDDIDNLVRTTSDPFDMALVAIVGLTAASIAAAAAIRSIRGSSEPYGVPLALAVLKLPTGAVTAVLGLILMRGQFIPGLSALDSSAQIIAWAAIFGYAQQLFTRLVDQQAHAVLDGVRGGDKSLEHGRSN